MNLSIFIPAKNRLYYVSKLIKYYSSIEFNGELIILDSSDNEIKDKIFELISIYKNLKIKYFHSLGLPCAMMKKYINEVSSDYVVFSGDDDYFVKSGLNDCLNFLNTNPNFSGCTGEGISVHSSSQRNKIDYIENYDQAKIYGSSSKERLSIQFKNIEFQFFQFLEKMILKIFLNLCQILKILIIYALIKQLQMSI